MEIREEWVHLLIKRGFSAHGARAMIKDLRETKADMGEEEFGQWLKTLKPADIPKILVVRHFGRSAND